MIGLFKYVLQHSHFDAWKVGGNQQSFSIILSGRGIGVGNLILMNWKHKSGKCGWGLEYFLRFSEFMMEDKKQIPLFHPNVKFTKS